MKRLLFIGLIILSIFCFTSCQSSDYGKKDDQSSHVDTGKTPDKGNQNPPKKDETKPPVKVFTPVENDAFKVTSVANDSTSENVLIVEGKARVFEATFLYRIEDGHNVLAEGHTIADMGAPEWGNFKLVIHYDQPTSPNGVLTLYVASAKDGQSENILNIPIQFPNYK
ncbi:Gmad2 immunoglobulin-like domain-containing protein [Bacillus sp. AFS055030]|uniref:Gmad2 immunoglobulin-like domain-containing protein n=1 Tax=Bacillus sp. AFS055030 TaxID=2033507 RepID=UPI0015D4FE27|nr:Gmad2 immunoglobulin-like domain-containing protein [Bacillus sp. AFS055030]